MRRLVLSILALVFLLIVSTACTQIEPEVPLATQIAATIFAEQTAEAELFTPTPPPPTLTETLTATVEPTPSPSPTQSPTSTPEPSPTRTPHPPSSTPTDTPTPGPAFVEDDFSQGLSAWLGCEVCDVKNGALLMGPYPIEGAYLQHNAICSHCGLARFYRMAVELNFVDGVSDRGYGLLLRYTEDYMLTMEITPWQTVDVWKYDFETNEWDWINGRWSGLVRPGQQKNTIEVVVRPTSSANRSDSDIFLKVNGKTAFVIYNQPTDYGMVGLTVFGHASEVSFHNFEFESEDPVIPIPPGLPGVIQG